MIKNTLLVIVSIATLLLIYKCNSVEPPINGNGQDTTSHNFSWQSWTFGEHSSSRLNDVAIISENNIWAVGEIYLNDSLGQPDPQAYGVAIWDGQNWKLKKLFYNTNIPVTPRGIFVIKPTEIYLASGSIFRWDGSSSAVQLVYSRLNLPNPNGTIEKLWRSSSSSIYGVGNAGSIVCYESSSWQRIESGTDLDIYDIWGDYNEANNEYEIIVVAAKQFVTYDKKILRINGNTVQSIGADSIPYSIHGLWFKSSKKYFVSGAGLYSKNNINSTTEWEWLHPEVTNYYLYAIRGQETNDLFACGAFGEIIHFNGSTWKSFINVTNISNGAYNNIDFKEDVVVAVGYDNPDAIINVGTR